MSNDAGPSSAAASMPQQQQQQQGTAAIGIPGASDDACSTVTQAGAAFLQDNKAAAAKMAVHMDCCLHVGNIPCLTASLTLWRVTLASCNASLRLFLSR
jgi:hypothetical protein